MMSDAEYLARCEELTRRSITRLLQALADGDKEGVMMERWFQEWNERFRWEVLKGMKDNKEAAHG